MLALLHIASAQENNFSQLNSSKLAEKIPTEMTKMAIQITKNS